MVSPSVPWVWDRGDGGRRAGRDPHTLNLGRAPARGCRGTPDGGVGGTYPSGHRGGAPPRPTPAD
ncbi:MAG: hypothetical protein AMXMBFR53_14330 [Gemmatimonadota bacterium]